MTEEWFQSRLEFFNDYVDEFRHCPEKDKANIDLKRDHSLRVLAEAEMILAGLEPKPDADFVMCVRTAALFHDIGRFVQYREYKTFSDKDSRNHGFLGCRELGRVDALNGIPKKFKDLVRGVVVMHNRRFVPGRLDPRLDRMVRLVRDADKLDIFKVMLDHFRPNGSVNEVVTLHLKPDPVAYTPGILDEALSGTLVDYTKMAWVNDFKLLVLSWVHDLNFSASKQAFRDRKYVERVLSTMPRLPQRDRLEAVLFKALED